MPQATVVAALCLDGLVCIPNRDKFVPGMLMAAARLNVPTIFLSGGPMAAGRTSNGQRVDLTSVSEGVGQDQAGSIHADQLQELEENGCPACGSCSGMFTANPMNCLMEALGPALPGNISAGSGQNLFLVKDGLLITNDASSSLIMGITPASIITLARNMGIPVEIAAMTRAMLPTADEACFTDIASKLTPIHELDDPNIGTSKP